MDGSRFDDLTRVLATGSSRRGLLKTLAGGLAVAVGALRGGGAEAITCRGAGRLCVQNANCCSGMCDPATHKCVGCPAGTEICAGVCKNPLTDYESDPLNCGECGFICPPGPGGTPVCTAGECEEDVSCDEIVCPPGDICLGGNCQCTAGSTCDGEVHGCGGSQGCFCATTAEGRLFCALNPGSFFCENMIRCETTEECGAGSACIIDWCCDFAFCLPVCGTLGVAAAGGETV